MTPENVKALFYVVVLAIPAFYIGKHATNSVITSREFAVWRAVWFVVTIAAFFSHNYFLFAAVIILICFCAFGVRAASVALYLVILLATPLIGVTLDGFAGINQLFELSTPRLLSIFLLLPILLFVPRNSRERSTSNYAGADRLIICYVLLISALELRQSAITNALRVGFLQTLDVLVPYFAFSRTIGTITDLRKVLLAFVIAVLPLSMIGMLETAKGWHLYSEIINNWGGTSTYVERNGLLRASASINGGPIIFGFIVMLALGFTLVIPQTREARKFAVLARTVFCLALVASLSRGPWVGAAVFFLAYVATGPGSSANLSRIAVIGAMVLVPLLLTPVGQQLRSLLPFTGSVDEQSVDYRRQLIENSMQVIERNPFFGSSDYMSEPEMEELRQGQGIIDIVNTYLGIALKCGLVGLGLFIAFFVAILRGLRRVLRFRFAQDPYFKTCVRVSIATLIAILVTIGTVSYIDVMPYVCWSFGGLCVALIRIASEEQAANARSFHAGKVPA